MVDRRRSIGQAAEEAAARWLTRAGLAVLERNVRFRAGEIDLVCRDGDVVVFVEVKCRRPHWGEGPADAVSWDKRRRLIRLAEHYLRARGLDHARCRFDVVAVTIEADRTQTVRHLCSPCTSECRSSELSSSAGSQTSSSVRQRTYDARSRGRRARGLTFPSGEA